MQTFKKIGNATVYTVWGRWKHMSGNQVAGVENAEWRKTWRFPPLDFRSCRVFHSRVFSHPKPGSSNKWSWAEIWAASRNFVPNLLSKLYTLFSEVSAGWQWQQVPGPPRVICTSAWGCVTCVSKQRPANSAFNHRKEQVMKRTQSFVSIRCRGT